MKKVISLIIVISFSVMLFGCATYNQQPASVQRGTQGAVLGGALGAAMGAAINSGNRGTGALIGGLLGAALGWVIGQYSATQVQSQPQLLNENPQAQSYYQQSLQQNRPEFLSMSSQLYPTPVHPGSTVGLAANYSFVAPPGRRVRVSEQRRIYDSKGRLLYNDIKNATRTGGQYRTVQEFKIPVQSRGGRYYYDVGVDIAGQRRNSGRREFMVASIHGQAMVVAIK